MGKQTVGGTYNRLELLFVKLLNVGLISSLKYTNRFITVHLSIYSKKYPGLKNNWIFLGKTEVYFENIIF